MDLPQFSGEDKEWPTLITTYRRTSLDWEFYDGKNMVRLRKRLSIPARNCVKMILLTYDSEKSCESTEKTVKQLLE
jgi:hypothetical protein